METISILSLETLWKTKVTNEDYVPSSKTAYPISPKLWKRRGCRGKLLMTTQKTRSLKRAKYTGLHIWSKSNSECVEVEDASCLGPSIHSLLVIFSICSP